MPAKENRSKGNKEDIINVSYSQLEDGTSHFMNNDIKQKLKSNDKKFELKYADLCRPYYLLTKLRE